MTIYKNVSFSHIFYILYFFVSKIETSRLMKFKKFKAPVYNSSKVQRQRLSPSAFADRKSGLVMWLDRVTRSRDLVMWLSHVIPSRDPIMWLDHVTRSRGTHFVVVGCAVSCSM